MVQYGDWPPGRIGSRIKRWQHHDWQTRCIKVSDSKLLTQLDIVNQLSCHELKCGTRRYLDQMVALQQKSMGFIWIHPEVVESEPELNQHGPKETVITFHCEAHEPRSVSIFSPNNTNTPQTLCECVCVCVCGSVRPHTYTNCGVSKSHQRHFDPFSCVAKIKIKNEENQSDFYFLIIWLQV